MMVLRRYRRRERIRIRLGRALRTTREHQLQLAATGGQRCYRYDMTYETNHAEEARGHA